MVSSKSMHSLANFTTSLTSSFMSRLPPLFGMSARFYYLTRIKKISGEGRSRTEVSNSKQWRRAQSARFDARRGPRKGLYGSILRHSFLSLPPPPPPTLPPIAFRSRFSLNSFLPPPPPSPSALFVSPQRVCSSPRSAVFPWAFFVSSGPRAGGESISEDGRGIKEPLLRASRLWQSALAPAEKYVTRENQFQRWLPRRPRP